MYPNKFRFQSVSAPVKQNNRNHESTHFNHVINFEPEAAKDTHYWEGFDESSWEGFSPHMDEQDPVPRERGTQNGSSSTNSSPVSGQQNDVLELNELLMLERTQRILTYYDNVICPHQIMLSGTETNNPYRSYILPLAYEQLGLLYALLGLSACHMALTNGEGELLEVADEYRLKCIGSLIQTIQKIISSQSHEDERDGLFATIQLLLLHDVGLFAFTLDFFPTLSQRS
ncbi:hypothetical protein N7478_005091 [Penicillium angulare]|uniref:uncharacterized protein n=1 Tax=Penicillium angulare TaxID=116970 RepID=UPI002540387D|nr:uncharacterized protein N7478_005091 [Penicillium angulare]KAJ5279719.1 hypothetical protein N7478_005091 [Penicillium angulare]